MGFALGRVAGTEAAHCSRGRRRGDFRRASLNASTAARAGPSTVQARPRRSDGHRSPPPTFVLFIGYISYQAKNIMLVSQ